MKRAIIDSLTLKHNYLSEFHPTIKKQIINR